MSAASAITARSLALYPSAFFPVRREDEPLFIEHTSWDHDDDDDEITRSRNKHLKIVDQWKDINAPPLYTTLRPSLQITSPAMATLIPHRGEFESFPLLPTEIQKKIWKLTMVPRIIEFKSGGGKAPGALHACPQSRGLLRKHYQLRISLIIDNYYWDDPHDFGIFVNWDIDIVRIRPYFNPRSFLSLDGSTWMHGARRLSYDGLLEVYHNFHPWGYLIQKMMFNMEEDKVETREASPKTCTFGDTFNVLWTREEWPCLKELMVVMDVHDEVITVDNLRPVNVPSEYEHKLLNNLESEFEQFELKGLLELQVLRNEGV